MEAGDRDQPTTRRGKALLPIDVIGAVGAVVEPQRLHQVELHRLGQLAQCRGKAAQAYAFGLSKLRVDNCTIYNVTTIRSSETSAWKSS